MIEKIHHYSLTGVPTIYDEEAMTAVELASRAAAKVNEVIDYTERELSAQDAAIEDIPVKIDDAVIEKINDGTFDGMIDDHLGGLDKRVDNLLNSYTPGANVAAAELYDIRLGANGNTYVGAGKAVRDQIRAINKGFVSFMESKNLFTADNHVVGYVTDQGNVNPANTAYNSTQAIPCKLKRGDYLWLSPGVRFLVLYSFAAEGFFKVQQYVTINDSDLSKNNRIQYTGTDECAYLRASWKTETDPASLFIVKGLTLEKPGEYKPAVALESLPPQVITGDVPAHRLAIMDSKNLFNPHTARRGLYMGLDGWCYESADYTLSDYIDVTPGERIFFTPNARFITAFNADGTINENAGRENYGSYIVPANVVQIFVTVRTEYLESFMINRGARALPYEPYRAKISSDFLPESVGGGNMSPEDKNKLEKAYSRVRGGTLIKDLGRVNGIVEINEFPRYIKYGQVMIATFDQWDGDLFAHNSSVSIGFGADGGLHSLEICLTEDGEVRIYGSDGEQITFYTFEGVENPVDKMTMTLEPCFDFSNDSLFVRLCIFYDNHNVYAYHIPVHKSFMGAPFVRAEKMNVTVKLRNTKFNQNIWFFGDSYVSSIPERPFYEFLDGVTDYKRHCEFLLAGKSGATTREMYDEFLRCLNYGRPEYVVFLTGMNDTDADFETYVDAVIVKCQAIGATPVFALIPNIPSKDHSKKHAYIKSLGVRYIDWNRTVGADLDSNWAFGGLSTDNVHPDRNGARALFNQIVEDLPEILIDKYVE